MNWRWATKNRVRLTEAAGTAMSLILTTNNPWGNEDYGRKDCITCGQGDKKRINCKKINVLYKSLCNLYNLAEGEKKITKNEMDSLKAEGGSMWERVQDRYLREQKSRKS